MTVVVETVMQVFAVCANIGVRCCGYLCAPYQLPDHLKRPE